MWFFAAYLFSAAAGLFMLSFVYDKFKTRNLRVLRATSFRLIKVKDTNYALETVSSLTACREISFVCLNISCSICTLILILYVHSQQIGDDSVYQFFLGTSVVGWFIFLGTIFAQMWMLFLFVQGAEIDLSNVSRFLS